MPERLSDGYLWAEDVTIFIKQGYETGGRAILTPYAGYLHLIPRLVVYVYHAAFGGVPKIPMVFAWTCALLTGAVCGYLYVIAARYTSRVAAFAIALSPVLLPHTGESWLNLTNLQWTLGPLLLAMLLDNVARKNSDYLPARCFVVALLALTGPFSALFLPLAFVCGFLLRARPDRMRRLAPLVIVIVAGVAQLAVYKFAIDHRPNHPAAEFLHYPWVSAFLKNFVMESLVGPKLQAMGHFTYAALIVTALILLCVLSVRGWWRGVNALLLAVAVGLWVLGVVRTDAPAVEVVWYLNGVERYTFMPLVLCMWALAIAAAESRISAVRYVSAAFLMLLIANGATQFQAPTIPTQITAVSDGAYLIQAAPGDPWHATVKPSR